MAPSPVQKQSRKNDLTELTMQILLEDCCAELTTYWLYSYWFVSSAIQVVLNSCI